MATTASKSKYPPASDGPDAATNRRGYWEEQLSKANKRWDSFEKDGDAVLDRFMLESKYTGDKYNILYSSTETIKPSLYGQTPKVEVKNRQTDTENNLKVAAAMLLEQVGQYAVDLLDFDYVMQNAVSDFVLPGIGLVWVRYDPQFAPMYENDNDKTPAKNEDGSDKEYLTFEGLALDYVHFKDFRCGLARYWHEVPWVSRRVFFTKKQATSRFGKEKANRLDYSFAAKDKKEGGKDDGAATKQAVIYEIWDKTNGECVWYSDGYADDLLDVRPDPLRLKDFFPCPRPLRAVWSSRSFIPKSLYSQYRAQAAELDRLTERIRYLTEALKVRGLYDGSQENLALVLEGAGNKMIPVQDWANFMGQGGVTGVVQWVPIVEVVQCLSELFKQREICKNEIYEITGFSDIVRGISKASETLGAQQIKADWATGRLKDMQREVQRFCRDIIRLFIEIAAEHFSDKTLMVYSGLTIPPPSPEEIQAQSQYKQAVQNFPQTMQQYHMAAVQAQQQGQPIPPQPQPPPPPGPTEGEQIQTMFNAVVKMIRSEKLRCAAVGIETDSTILPDEQKERQDRMQFLSSMGAFLQQAAPMAMQFPDMRGLLGGIMMFTLRTFSASRPLEKEFESFQKKLEAMPPTPPPGQSDNGQAAAASAQAVAGIKAQTDTATASQADATKRYEIDQRVGLDRQKAADDHQYRMAQISLANAELELKRKQLGLDTLNEERAHDVEMQRTAVEATAETADAEAQRQHEAQQAELDRQHEGNLEDLKQEYDAEKIGSQQQHEIELADKESAAEDEGEGTEE
jgi:hypothetical protein